MSRFHQGFVAFYRLLDDKDELVVQNTLMGFSTLTEYYPEVFMENREISQIFMHFLSMAKRSNK